MPRVLNLALSVVLLALVAPVVTKFGGKPVYVQIALVGTVVLFLPLLLACLASAARPGSVGRFARRLRRR